MKSNIRIFFLSHSQDESCFGQENGLIVFVVGDIVLSVFHEILQIRLRSAHPTGLVNAAGFESTLGAVFVLQTILKYFKLKFTHGANKFSIA